MTLQGKREESSTMPKHINFVLLSATITRPEIFGNWLQEISDKRVNLIKYNKRPVPLVHTLFYNFGKISKHQRQQNVVILNVSVTYSKIIMVNL